MKKTRLAGLLLLAPLMGLCACTETPALSINANWYRNTALTSVSNTHEKLEYEVTFFPDETAEYSVDYDKGTYTTELSSELLTLPDGKTEEGYVLTSDLKISGRFTVKGETGESFEDSVHSVVKFRPVTHRLQPIESEKTVYATSPISQTPSSLQTATEVFHYSYAVTYNADLTSATAKYTDLKTGSEKTTEYSLKGDGTYLDNEQILFALRGVSMNSIFTFRSINQVTGRVEPISIARVPEATKEKVSFQMGDTQADEEINLYSLTLSYKTYNSGMAQTLVYAGTTDASNNTYRNVLIRYEVPILQSLGKLQYKLVKADFSDKN